MRKSSDMEVLHALHMVGSARTAEVAEAAGCSLEHARVQLYALVNMGLAQRTVKQGDKLPRGKAGSHRWATTCDGRVLCGGGLSS